MRYPSVEVLLINWLAEKFPSVVVLAELPPSFRMEDSLPIVQITRIGGRQLYRNVVDAPRVDIDVFAQTRVEAAELSQQLAYALNHELTNQTLSYHGESGVITRVVEEVGPSFRVDYNERIRRYGATYVINVRPSWS